MQPKNKKKTALEVDQYWRRFLANAPVTAYRHLPPRENMGHGSSFESCPMGSGITHFSPLPSLRGGGISTFMPNEKMIQEMTSFVTVDSQIIMKS